MRVAIDRTTHDLHAPPVNCDEIDTHSSDPRVAPAEVHTRPQESSCLVIAKRLARTAACRSSPPLDLDKHQLISPPTDQIDLSTADPHVAAEHPIPATEIEQRSDTLTIASRLCRRPTQR